MRKAAQAAPSVLVLALMGAYWLGLYWLFVDSPAMCAVTGACNEPGIHYGSWSGFGGTVLFSALVLLPPWYYRHTCHHSPWCLRWGAHEAAGGVFRLCRVHHPDLRGQRPHRDLIHRLHAEWKARGQ